MTDLMMGTIFLSLVLVSQCYYAFALVPALPKPEVNISPLQEGSLLDCRRGESIDGVTDVESKFSLATTRRGAIGCSVSLLTTVSFLPLQGASAADFDPSSTPTAEPFTVTLTLQIDASKPEELTEIEIECRPDWAPLAAGRFKELVQLGFYNDCPFFRVLPGFISQFGVSSDPKLNRQWLYCDTTADEETVKLCKSPLVDEPRRQSNKKGTLSFASSGKNSRKTQIFINTGDNSGPPNFLDGQNFVPFGRVVRGMDAIKQLNSEYGGKVNQGKAAYYGGEYFQKVFPNLSMIRTAKLV